MINVVPTTSYAQLVVELKIDFNKMFALRKKRLIEFVERPITERERERENTIKIILISYMRGGANISQGIHLYNFQASNPGTKQTIYVFWSLIDSSLQYYYYTFEFVLK